MNFVLIVVAFISLLLSLIASRHSRDCFHKEHPMCWFYPPDSRCRGKADEPCVAMQCIENAKCKESSTGFTCHCDSDFIKDDEGHCVCKTNSTYSEPHKGCVGLANKPCVPDYDTCFESGESDVYCQINAVRKCVENSGCTEACPASFMMDPIIEILGPIQFELAKLKRCTRTCWCLEGYEATEEGTCKRQA